MSRGPGVSRWMLFVVWVFALTLLGAILWRPMVGADFPLQGARQVADAPASPIYVLAYLLTAIWLSIPKFHTRDRYLILVGAAGSSALISLLALSLAMAVAWAAVAQAVIYTMRLRALASGPETVTRKLDLARAHIDMGNSAAAETILREVCAEGSEAQKREAARLLEGLERRA